jgi:anti-sigma factor RsiW
VVVSQTCKVVVADRFRWEFSMDHSTVSQRLSAYMDSEVMPGERAAIEKHLAECPVCAATLRDFQLISTTVRGFEPPEMDAAVLHRLHNGVDQIGRRPVERFVGLLSGLAACLAVIGGLMLLRPAATTPVAPDRWEGHAAGIIDETLATSVGGTREVALGQWMVSNLSTRGQGNE